MTIQHNLTIKTKLDYWPFAIGPVAMTIVYLLYALDLQSLLGKGIHEYIHLVLIAAAFVIFAASAVKQRQQFHFIMTALCFAFLCREIHFAGTTKGVYISIAIIAVWTVLKFDQIKPILEMGKIKPWLYATGFTYILSQLIARRIFKRLNLPNEQLLHVMLEEVVETSAHLLMLITAIIALRTKTTPKQTGDNTKNQQS